MNSAFFLISIFIAFMLLKYFLGKRLDRHRKPTEDELLCTLALDQGSSVYDIFKIAGDEWACSDTKIENDFTNYLNTADIPPYVRQHLRSQTISRNTICQERPQQPFGTA